MRKNANQRMRGVLAASALSMVLAACLGVGSTFAWFQDGLGSENTIKIGSFGVRATASLSEAKSATQLSSTDTVFSPGSYELSVRGVGDTPGYALIFLEASTSDFRKDSYYTPQLNGGTEYTYRIVLHEPTAIRVTPVWGRMEGDAPLKEDKIIWYGRPPVVKQPEEEQNGDVTAAPPTENAETVTPNNSTQTAPPADGTQTTPLADSTSPATPAEGAGTTPDEGKQTAPPTDGAPTATPADDVTTTTGGGEDTSTTGGTQTSTSTGSTPPAGGAESAVGSTPQTPATGSKESVPAAGETDGSPAAAAVPE